MSTSADVIPQVMVERANVKDGVMFISANFNIIMHLDESLPHCHHFFVKGREFLLG
jgi:hypothetical protein